MIPDFRKVDQERTQNALKWFQISFKLPQIAFKLKQIALKWSQRKFIWDDELMMLKKYLYFWSNSIHVSLCVCMHQRLRVVHDCFFFYLHNKKKILISVWATIFSFSFFFCSIPMLYKFWIRILEVKRKCIYLMLAFVLIIICMIILFFFMSNVTYMPRTYMKHINNNEIIIMKNSMESA